MSQNEQQVRALITENNVALKAELDRERDSYALQNVNTIRLELNALFERTQGMVTQVAANHQSQIDHVNRVNVEQEAFLNAKRADIAAIMTQLGPQKTELDSATRALQARDEEVRASILSKQAKIATAFANNNAALQQTISVGRADFWKLQEELRAKGDRWRGLLRRALRQPRP